MPRKLITTLRLSLVVGLGCSVASPACAPQVAVPASAGDGQARANGPVTIRLSGGSGSTLSTWAGSGVVWDTSPGGYWVLGIASSVTGPLMNGPDTQLAALPEQPFFAFGEPADPGTTAKLEVIRADGSALVALFAVRGGNGSGAQWDRIDGSPELSVAWSRDLGDRVGPGQSLSASGTIDQSFVIGIGMQPAGPAANTSIVGTTSSTSAAAIRLSGGQGSSLSGWSGTGVVWDTTPGTFWVLGVAPGLTAALLNRADTSIPTIPRAPFLAFGEPANPGPTAKLEVILDDGRALVSLFTVRGVNGSGEQWQLIDGSPRLSLAWSKEVADRVGPRDALTASSTIDNVFAVAVSD